MTDDGTRRAAHLAAGLAFASAAVSAYWVAGGTALLDTVGGYAEDLARERSALALLVGTVVIGAKVVAGLLALAVAARRVRFRRLLLVLGSAGGLLLTVYGALLVAVGALVLTDVLRPDGPVDRRVLTWHVALWDAWFVVWGVALLVTVWTSRTRTPSTVGATG